ncbi:hypothetical protein [Pontibacter chinhatensis]|uniref:Uncharacterized protein n=1 Tax=Pontibacter chinhatensis TaxID=1436961 RepID=A0A1I2THZ3_9BACT|nr:hypothetical protein [Pontibacter chinhatensis]SFG62987.1 hypothetical protein SAMN05421739_10391 [Pontibacter chinhatensis]
MKNKKHFALSESIADNKQWLILLNAYLGQADFAEFNVLYDPTNLLPELEALEPDLVEAGKRSDKFYASGSFRRYRLSPRVKDFILSKPYNAWRNYQFEDLSLLKDGTEILATITHENYIFARMSEQERAELNRQELEFGALQETKE